MKPSDLKDTLYYYYYYYFYNYLKDNPDGKSNLPSGAEWNIPALIASVIALSLALLVIIIYGSAKDSPSYPFAFEAIIEWLPGILAVACAYSALWMLAYYCTGRNCPHLGIHAIFILLRKPQLYGPYWFLEMIFAAYFLVLILEFMIGKLQIWPVPT